MPKTPKAARAPKMSNSKTAKSSTVPKSLGAIQVELEITIHAPLPQVWHALVHEIGLWWRQDFYCAGGKRFAMEPRVGGRVYEDDGSGGGLLWYTVHIMTAPRLLQLIGHLSPPWGGPAVSLIRIELVEQDKSTVLRLTDHCFGVVSAKLKRNLHEGWTLLMADALKSHLETKSQ
jgi:uncharacterized protein YndB with AHSA1/START domain